MFDNAGGPVRGDRRRGGQKELVQGREDGEYQSEEVCLLSRLLEEKESLFYFCVPEKV